MEGADFVCASVVVAWLCAHTWCIGLPTEVPSLNLRWQRLVPAGQIALNGVGTDLGTAVAGSTHTHTHTKSDTHNSKQAHVGSWD